MRSVWQLNERRQTQSRVLFRVFCVRLTYDRFHFLLDLGQHTSRYLRMRMHGWWRHHSIRVIHLHVALQIAALDESLAAQCARVRFLARMGAHVRDQVTCETDNGSDMKISADKERSNFDKKPRVAALPTSAAEKSSHCEPNQFERAGGRAFFLHFHFVFCFFFFS